MKWSLDHDMVMDHEIVMGHMLTWGCMTRLLNAVDTESERRVLSRFFGWAELTFDQAEIRYLLVRKKVLPMYICKF
jgi:hypothetical protein